MPSIPKQDLRMTSNSLWLTMSKAVLRSSATRDVTSWSSFPFKISINLRSRVSVKKFNNNCSGIGVAGLDCTGVLEFEEEQHFPIILI